MKKYFKEAAFIFLALFISQLLSANINSNVQPVDSLNALLLKEYKNKTLEIEQQGTTDSTKRVELERQILLLKSTDYLKKEELLKRLETLTNKESDRIANKKAKINELRLTAKSFPVIGFFNDTLFNIYSKLGSFSAHDRAEAISTRIKKLSDIYYFKSDSLKIIETETTEDLVFGESIILSVTENDALWNNTTKSELAAKYREIINSEVLKFYSETSFITMAKEIGLALLVLIILGGILFYLNKFFSWSAAKIQLQEGKFIKGIKIRDYTVFDEKRQINVLITFNRILKWAIIILLVYITLPILLGIFPWTKNYAGILLGYILNPIKNMANSVWNYLPKFFTIIVIVFVFRYILKGTHFLKDELEKGNLSLPGFYAEWANPTYQIIKVFIIAFMMVLIFPYLPGSDSPIFRGVSVFLGVLFTFGSSGSLSNIIAGLVLTYMRLFKIGDRVKFGDIEGDVIEKSLLVTRIRTIKNEIISIPNSTVMSSHTINYSSDTVDNGLILHTTVTIGYDVPWRDMHQALIKAADRTELILKEPKPFVLQTSLDDFYVSYQINAYTKEANKQATIYSQLHQNIQDCCNEAGIEILSPHYRSVRDGNMTSIPTNYLDKDYKVPRFGVTVEKESGK